MGRRRQALINLHFLLLIGWAVAIAWLSLGSTPSVDIDILDWDKLQHAGAYGLLMLLALQSLSDFKTLNIANGCLCWAAVVLYGGLLEIAQVTLTDHRYAEWWDLVADGVGAAVALGFILLLKRSQWIK